MRFQVTQRFAAPVEAVLAAYTDPAFYDELVGLPKVGEPKVLERTAQGTRALLGVPSRFPAAPPPAAPRVIAPAKLPGVEETPYAPAAATSRSKLVPDHYPDRLTASATA